MSQPTLSRSISAIDLIPEERSDSPTAEIVDITGMANESANSMRLEITEQLAEAARVNQGTENLTTCWTTDPLLSTNDNGNSVQALPSVEDLTKTQHCYMRQKETNGPEQCQYCDHWCCQDHIVNRTCENCWTEVPYPQSMTGKW